MPLLLAIALLPGMSRTADACKYSVRDIGFAHWPTAAVTVHVILPADRLEAFPAGWIDRIVWPSDVTCRLLPADSPEARQVLLAAGLEMRSPVAEPQSPVPWLGVVCSATTDDAGSLSDRQPWAIPLPTDVSKEPERMIAALRALVQTERRDRLKADLLRHHSVLLVIGGTHGNDFTKAKQMAHAAAEEVAGQLGSLPKAIATPPIVHTLMLEEQADEAGLLWSLGIAPEPTEATRIVVLYGRLRRMGDVMQVPGITQRELTAVVSLVGQDCECDLGRSWTHLPHGWHTWTEADDAAAYQQLGFDPGNPLVIAEMTRILARGPGASRAVAVSEAADPLLGFDVISLPDAGAPTAVSTHPPVTESSVGDDPRAAPDGDSASADPTPREPIRAASTASTANRPGEGDLMRHSAASKTRPASAAIQHNRTARTTWLRLSMITAGGLALLVTFATLAVLVTSRSRDP